MINQVIPIHSTELKTFTASGLKLIDPDTVYNVVDWCSGKYWITAHEVLQMRLYEESDEYKELLQITWYGD